VSERANKRVLELATPVSSVSAFVRAVLKRLLPENTFGEGKAGQENSDRFSASVDTFIRQRRFESMTLHEVTQNLKVGGGFGTGSFY
jgi:telomerase reverse transcriptase